MNLIYKITLLISLFSSSLFALDITLNIPIYEPLSKTSNTYISGSSSFFITKSDLIKQENSPVHSILDQESGIKSRSIYGSNSSGSKTTLDIRGMGAQAKSNVLILVNGQRLNNIDMSEIDFPSIPRESIDKIEVIKGNAATVLYGDGAIGGAINIITDPTINYKYSNKIILKSGTFNSKEIIYNNKNNFKKYYLNTFFNHSETDGYRDENEQQQNNFTSELRYPGKKGDHFFAVNFSEQIMSTPGDRSQTQLFNDRKGSDTPDDYINSEGGSLIYSTDYKVDENIKLILNSSFRLKNSYSDLQSGSFPSYSDTSLTNYQITPRINHKSNFLSKKINYNYGVDIQHAEYKSFRKESENVIPLHIYDAWQSSQSIYVQQTTNISEKFNFGSGIRLQRSKIKINDELNTSAPDYAGWQTEHETYSNQENNYSFNLGADYQAKKSTNIYSRIGTGFRYPNIDDRIGGSGGTSLQLNTQKTQEFEIGLKYNKTNFFYNLSAYIIEGENELAYDTDAFENININSTRRFGIELITKNILSKKIQLKNNFTFAKAKYTSGNQGSYATDFEGKDVPLVPQYSLDSILEYKILDTLKLNYKIKYQDDMRMESDDENFQNSKIPSYIISNVDLFYKYNKFHSSLSINNILDDKYYNYAVASSSTVGSYNAYPEPGREIIFLLGFEF
tara:strand:- start:755 stop:2785 length:2031 start_codon:yes stop_codon:yes gene_type:complete